MGKTELKLVLLKSILLAERGEEEREGGQGRGEESDIKEKIKLDNYWSSGGSAVPGRV